MKSPFLICMTLSAACSLACAAPRLTTPPPVAVTVVVDFGTPDRAPLSGQTLVPADSSPIEALVEVADVERRFVARMAGDVWGVNGVATDPEAGLYWTWRLNGRGPPGAPERYELQNGDRITWTFGPAERPAFR